MNIGYLFIFLAFLLYLLNNSKKPLVGGDGHDKKKIPSYISIDTNEKMKIWGLLTNNKNFQDELTDYLTLEYATDNNDDNKEQIKTLKNNLDSRNYNAFLDNIYNHFETLDSSDASQEIITLQSFFIDNKQTDMINDEQPVMDANDEQPVMAVDAVSQQQSAEISNKQEDTANEKEIGEEIILSMQQKGRVYSCILSNVD